MQEGAQGWEIVVVTAIVMHSHTWRLRIINRKRRIIGQKRRLMQVSESPLVTLFAKLEIELVELRLDLTPMKVHLSLLIDAACLLITNWYHRPQLQWIVRARRCAFKDRLSSVAVESSRPWAGRFGFAVWHSLPSISLGSSLIHRQLYSDKNAKHIAMSINILEEQQRRRFTYLSASICKFLRTSVDLCERTFSNCSFSCLSICTSRFENWISSFTWRIISCSHIMPSMLNQTDENHFIFCQIMLTYLKTAKFGFQAALGRHGVSTSHLTLGGETELLGAHYLIYF